jgi:heme/copper-type cytochrome/quinol oxidase subunit 4
MAKRRKEKDEEEEKPFKIPKFDEEEFLKKERRHIKAAFIAFLFGVIMALVCFGFWALMGSDEALRWPLVFLIAIVYMFSMRYFFLRLDIDISDFTRGKLITTYGTYLFSWLLIFIVLTNPPFFDDEAPIVEIAVLPEMQETGGNITFFARVTDNVQIDIDSLNIEITYPNANITNLSPIRFEYYDSIIEFVYENTEKIQGDFTYIFSVKDINNRITTKTGTFTYDNDVIDVRALQSYEKITSATDVKVDVDEKVSTNTFRVFYRLNNGDEINVNRETPTDKGDYETSPEFEGWEENSNYSMKFYIEVSHFFNNFPVKYSNYVGDSDIYYISTGNDNDIGDTAPPIPWNWSELPQNQKKEDILNYDYVNFNDDGDNAKSIDNDELYNKEVLPHYIPIQVPGFEAILLLIALFAVILIFKYKQKDEKKQK